MKIAFHTYAFGPHGGWVPTYLVEEAIERTARLGYDGVELDAARPHVWPYDIDNEHRKNIKNLLGTLNLELPAVSGYYFGLNFASPLPSERQDAANYLEACVKMCADLGAKTLVVVPGVVVYGTNWDDAWDMSLDSMHKGIQKAEELGVYIGLEYVNTLWSNLVTTPYLALRMMKQINSPAVKLVLDSAHAFYNGENLVDVVRLFGKDLVHVHFEDCITGAPETRAIPGEGDVDLLSFAQTLKEIDYQGALTVELWGSQPEKYGRAALASVRGMLEKLDE